jgi:hypothetical protein
MKYLYGASVQGIQGFIFETNELKSIIGASEIIENINTKIAKKYSKHIIVNAAGNIKLLFNDKAECEELVRTFIKEEKQNAFGITISQAVEAFDKGDLKNAFNRLEKKLTEARNQPEIPLDLSINIIELASKTAKPMVENKKDKATLQKEEAYEKKYKDKKEFSQIAKLKNTKSKIAIIHADGNGLGAMIASMANNTSSDDEVATMYKEFSQNLKEATESAIDDAKKDVANLKLRQVIVGGDDLTVICDANSALEFTYKYLESFEKRSKEIFKNEGLTACAGIAFCNHKYPFHYAVNLAESLCKESKTHSKKLNKKLAPSSLMFHNIQSSSFTDFQDYIESELTLRPKEHKAIYLNYGPYFIAPQDEYSMVRDFLNLAQALRVKGSPMTRLRDWLSILGEDFDMAQQRLTRICEMMDLRDNGVFYQKSSLENALRVFNSDISLDKLIYRRGDVLVSPIHDVDKYLSVTDGGQE